MAPVGTVAVICVSEFTVKLAATPLKLTAVAPVKLLPIIVTVVPAGPLVGVKEVIDGVTAKLDELVPVPAGFVTWIGPLMAPAGTTAVKFELLTKLNEAETPLKVTDVVPVQPLPFSVTTVPTGPLVGVKEEIDGLPVTVKPVELVPTRPDWVDTVIRPELAKVGTVAVICVSELIVNCAAWPLKATTLAAVKPEPVMVITDPGGSA